MTSARKWASKFDRPIFILSTPRSGSTLLFETLQKAPGVFTTGDENHLLIESLPQLIPALRGWDSNRLLARDALPDLTDELARRFYLALRDRDGRTPRDRVTMIEKTPKNALRVPFFDAIWPDAQFVYLYRDARETLASMIEAWRSGRFRTYARLPDWSGPDWSLLLVPGWRELNGQPLGTIVAEQWARTTATLLDDLEEVSPDRVHPIDYRHFVSAPDDAVGALATSLGIGWDRSLGAALPLSRMTQSPPSRDKWKIHEREIEAVWPIVEALDARARSFAARNRP